MTRDLVHELDGRAIGMAANSLGRKTVSDAAREIEQLRELLSAYVADENRFNRGEGEPYGSISTETGMRARAALRQ